MARKRNNTLIASLVLTVAAALVSCDRKTVFASYDHTPVAGWEKNDTLRFGPIKIEESGDYSEEVGLRINGAYPFQSLSLVVEHCVYPRGTVFVDTLTCPLVAPDGTVKGQGVSYYQYKFDTKNLFLSKGDSIHIYIRHNMKREILPGVADVGVRIKAH